MSPVLSQSELDILEKGHHVTRDIPTLLYPPRYCAEERGLALCRHLPQVPQGPGEHEAGESERCAGPAAGANARHVRRQQQPGASRGEEALHPALHAPGHHSQAGGRPGQCEGVGHRILQVGEV